MIRNEILFLWILPMCKLRDITHKVKIKSFEIYSVCELFAEFTHPDKIHKNEIHTLIKHSLKSSI